MILASLHISYVCVSQILIYILDTHANILHLILFQIQQLYLGPCSTCFGPNFWKRKQPWCLHVICSWTYPNDNWTRNGIEHRMTHSCYHKRQYAPSHFFSQFPVQIFKTPHLIILYNLFPSAFMEYCRSIQNKY